MNPTFNALPNVVVPQHPALSLFGWGCGDTGQLGIGPIPEGGNDEWSRPEKNMFVEKMILENAFGADGAGLVAIAAGGMHSLAADENGTVWSFGINDEGTLGRETENVPDPSRPGDFLPKEDLEATPMPVQVIASTDFHAVQVAAGDSVSAAVSSNGELRVWGSFRDSSGIMGLSADSKRQFIPKPIVISPRSARSREQFVSVAVGKDHVLALTTHGSIYAFGNGECGQLGRKIIKRRKIHGTVPEKLVLGTRSRKAVLIGAGYDQSFAVDDRGVLWGWGLNSVGQLGVGMNQNDASQDEATIVETPRKVIGTSREELGGAEITAISGGDCFTLFLASDGRVYTCGSSIHGQLGLSDSDEAFRDRQFEQFLSEPVLVTFPIPDPITRISAGGRSSLAIAANGTIFSWGQHNQGGLGLGKRSDAPTPLAVAFKDGPWGAEAVSCGGPHCLALLRKL